MYISVPNADGYQRIAAELGKRENEKRNLLPGGRPLVYVSRASRLQTNF